MQLCLGRLQPKAGRYLQRYSQLKVGYSIFCKTDSVCTAVPQTWRSPTFLSSPHMPVCRQDKIQTVPLGRTHKLWLLPEQFPDSQNWKPRIDISHRHPLKNMNSLVGCCGWTHEVSVNSDAEIPDSSSFSNSKRGLLTGVDAGKDSWEALTVPTPKSRVKTVACVPTGEKPHTSDNVSCMKKI